MRTATEPLSPDSLDANRLGELSEKQQRNIRAWAWSNRKNALSIALYFLAGAVLVGFFASSTAPIVTRSLIVVICLTIAVVLIIRAVLGIDALTRDVRSGRVESVEGAIGKRRVSSGRLSNRYIEVGDRRFNVGYSTYQALPDAGFVRLYFLPRSKKIVNVERIGPPPPSEPIPLNELGSLAATSMSRDRRKAYEARAVMAGIEEAMQAAHATSSDSPRARDPRPLAESIVGTWTNVMMTVTFSADGTVSALMAGRTMTGHWAVDDAGRVRSDITGRPENADASIIGDQLTIMVHGEGLTFTRKVGS